jgi:hypothetical protein
MNALARTSQAQELPSAWWRRWVRHTFGFSWARPADSTPSEPVKSASIRWVTSSLRWPFPKCTSSSPRAAMKWRMSATNALLIGSISAVEAYTLPRWPVKNPATPPP